MKHHDEVEEREKEKKAAWGNGFVCGIIFSIVVVFLVFIPW